MAALSASDVLTGSLGIARGCRFIWRPISRQTNALFRWSDATRCCERWWQGRRWQASWERMRAARVWDVGD